MPYAPAVPSAPFRRPVTGTPRRRGRARSGPRVVALGVALALLAGACGGGSGDAAPRSRSDAGSGAIRRAAGVGDEVPAPGDPAPTTTIAAPAGGTRDEPPVAAPPETAAPSPAPSPTTAPAGAGAGATVGAAADDPGAPTSTSTTPTSTSTTTSPATTTTTGPKPPPTAAATDVADLAGAGTFDALLALAAGCRGATGLPVGADVTVDPTRSSRLLGLPLAGSVRVVRDAPDSVRVAVSTTLPAVLAGGAPDAVGALSLTYTCAAGIQQAEVKVQRSSLAQLFTVRDAWLRWDGDRGRWDVSAVATTAEGRTTTLTGWLGVTDGTISGGELDLRRLPLAGLFVVDHLHLAGSTAGAWNGRLAVTGERNTSVASADVSLTFADDGTLQQGSIDFASGVPLFGVIPLAKFTLDWDAPGATWSAFARTSGGTGEASTFRLGSRDGAVTGAAFTLATVRLTAGLRLDALRVEYAPDGAGSVLNGSAQVTLPGSGAATGAGLRDARVDGTFRFVDGAFADGRLVTQQLPVTFGDVPVVLDLDARVAAEPWRIDGDARIRVGPRRGGAPLVTVGGSVRTDLTGEAPVWTFAGDAAVGATALGRGEVHIGESGEARFSVSFGGAGGTGELDYSSVVGLAGRVEGRIGPETLTGTGEARLSVLFTEQSGAVSLGADGLVACSTGPGERIGFVWRWSAEPEPRTGRCDLAELGGPVPDRLPTPDAAADRTPDPQGRRTALETRFDALAGCGRTSRAVVGKKLTDRLDADLTEFGLGAASLDVEAVGAQYLVAKTTVTAPAVIGGGSGILTIAHRCDRGIVGAGIAVRNATLAGLFRIDAATLDWTDAGTWAATGDVVDAVGRRTRLSGSLTFSDRVVTGGSLELGATSLAGLVRVRTFRVAYDQSTGWVGTLAVEDTSKPSKGSVDLAFAPDGTLLRGSIGLKSGATLFGVLAVDDLGFAYDAGAARWNVALATRLAGVGGTSFALGTENGVVTGAGFALSKVGIPGVLTIDRLAVSYQRGPGTETYSGEVSVVLPGTANSTVGGFVEFTNGELTRLALAADRIPAVIGGVPVGLTLRADVRTAPWRIAGTAGIEIGPVQTGLSLVGVQGRVAYRFPTTASDGRTTAGVWEIGGDVLVAGRVLGGGDLILDGGATARLQVRLGSADGTRPLAFGDWFGVSGVLDGTVGPSTFDLGGQGAVTVFGWTGSGRMRINQYGIVGCGKGSSGFVARWGSWPSWLWTSCSPQVLDAPV